MAKFGMKATVMDSPDVYTYIGKRDGNTCIVTVNGAVLDCQANDVSVPLAQFEWGYNGAGPARLSFAMLAHYFRDNRKALAAYRTFCDLVIAELEGDEWCITTEIIADYFDRTVEVPMTLDELLGKVRGSRI